MRQGNRVRRYAAVALVACSMLLAELVAGSAQAAPPPNVVKAKQCLDGGWRTLTTSDERHFRNLGQCVVYALLGGDFGTPRTGGNGGQTE